MRKKRISKKKKEIILISACLLGVRCRYDAGSRPNRKMLRLAKTVRLMPFCPEQLGGLPTPREQSERLKDRVVTITGKDVTVNFMRGARQTLLLAKIFNVKKAYVKARSGACGAEEIYDGSFSGNLIPGDGVTSELLRKNGIEIVAID